MAKKSWGCLCYFLCPLFRGLKAEDLRTGGARTCPDSAATSRIVKGAFQCGRTKQRFNWHHRKLPFYGFQCVLTFSKHSDGRETNCIFERLSCFVRDGAVSQCTKRSEFDTGRTRGVGLQGSPADPEGGWGQGRHPLGPRCVCAGYACVKSSRTLSPHLLDPPQGSQCRLLCPQIDPSCDALISISRINIRYRSVTPLIGAHLTGELVTGTSRCRVQPR